MFHEARIQYFDIMTSIVKDPASWVG